MKAPVKLQRTILMRVVPGTLLTLLAIVSVSRLVAVHVVEDQVTRGLQLASTFKANQMLRELESLQASARVIATNDLIINSIVNAEQRTSQIPPFLRSLSLPNSAYRRITMSDYRGRPLVSSVASNHVEIDEFMTPLAGGHEITHVSPERILVACPIRFQSAASSSTEGVIAIEFDTLEFLDRLGSTTEPHRFRVFLNDALIFPDRQPVEQSQDWISLKVQVPEYRAIQIEQSVRRDHVLSYLRSLDAFLFGVFVLSAAAVCGSILYASRIAIAPLDSLVAQIESIEGKQGLSRPIVTGGPLEFQKLTQSFNKLMADLSATTVSRDELRATMEQLELALQGGNIGMWRWDLEKNTFEVSQELSRQLGETVAFDSFETFMAKLHPGDVLSTNKAIEDCTGGLTAGYEATFRLRHRDGSFRWILSRGKLSRGKSSQGTSSRGTGMQPEQMIGVHVDITERIQSEEKLRLANANLARSNEELAQFASVASHDLQEPLRKILSFASLLQEEAGRQLTDDARLFLLYIVDGAQRMRTLIHDLLEFSRVESEGHQQARTSARQAVDQAIHNLQLAIQESNAHIQCTDLPFIEADEQQLVQLFQNLISNSIKYSEDTPQVHISAHQEGGNWIFRVADNGIGIEPAYHSKIFGVFQRLHGRETYAGNGIGLAICRRIIDRWGGKIWIEPNHPQGAVFVFSIPHPEPVEPCPSAAPLAIPKLTCDDLPFVQTSATL